MKQTKFKIEKGVPIPRLWQPGRPGEDYPLKQMEIGDSFFIPGGKANQANNICQRGRLNGWGRFSYRAVNGGVRIWRVAKKGGNDGAETRGQVQSMRRG